MPSDSDEIELEVADSVASVKEAAHLFDHPVDDGATRAFLDDRRHVLLVARIGGHPVGFVSGVELTHPDKARSEMFVYELGVDEDFRRRGIATALMQGLIALCETRGCGEMFVLTEHDNEAALATYRKALGTPEPAGVMFTWHWTDR
ncbi:MAG TPA: GNAT family N-acetyltransferase [Actinomycetota bacterium]|nr:GNAT family N-acetyltransferase [Actinomycetota bacterium]